MVADRGEHRTTGCGRAHSVRRGSSRLHKRSTGTPTTKWSSIGALDADALFEELKYIHMRIGAILLSLRCFDLKTSRERSERKRPGSGRG